MSASQNGDGAAAELFDVPKRPRGKARRRAGKPRRSSLDLFHWNDLPEYLKDNEYIVTGYRADTGFLGSLKSLFRLHNESGNVWTHLCGAPSDLRPKTRCMPVHRASVAASGH